MKHTAKRTLALLLALLMMIPSFAFAEDGAAELIVSDAIEEIVGDDDLDVVAGEGDPEEAPEEALDEAQTLFDSLMQQYFG